MAKKTQTIYSQVGNVVIKNLENKIHTYGDILDHSIDRFGRASLHVELTTNFDKVNAIMDNNGSNEEVRSHLIELATLCINAVTVLLPDEQEEEEPSNIDEDGDEDDSEDSNVEESSDEDSELEKELEEYTKDELATVAAALDIKVNKKWNKTLRVEAIMKECKSHKDVYEALDNLE